MGRAVAIVGTGHSKFGVRNDVNIAELAWEAMREAASEAGIELRDVDQVVVGNAGGWSSEYLSSIVLLEYAGISGKPVYRVEAACATGSAAIKAAHDAIAAGEADLVLVVGVEKMNESPTPIVVEMIGRAGNYFWEFENFGLTFPGYYALYATAYMSEFGATEEDLCRVAVKNHHHASMNPKAHFPRAITLEQCLQSRYVAWPLKLYDSSPITDGAAAVVMASEDLAKKLTDSPVWIHSIGMASDTSNLSKRPDFLVHRASRLAAERAFKKLGIEIEGSYKHFDFANVHDAFTIAEILAYEAMGFAKLGEGYKLVREEQTYVGGLIPVNLDGGLKAKGHPIGATGVSMAVEHVRQLQGRVEKGRQAEIKRGRSLAHNVGGTGHYAFVTVYGLDKPRSR
ncbi:putative 3-ketoacyl-CoA thiolase [Aeropyrum pernix]|uniref:Putative 3-ketoacyl-CoA thiolase n=1 Tax=Aeropyrum pernix TaxID=56636 RepID=A0A401H987_AERPX|nr:thiolase domain-containing protein [Aeropyrum pernix]GBF08987.1 putative 3-ketoacyl-CoA thiolase [Aeropyrum pernix]